MRLFCGEDHSVERNFISCIIEIPLALFLGLFQQFCFLLLYSRTTTTLFYASVILNVSSILKFHNHQLDGSICLFIFASKLCSQISKCTFKIPAVSKQFVYQKIPHEIRYTLLYSENKNDFGIKMINLSDYQFPYEYI